MGLPQADYVQLRKAIKNQTKIEYERYKTNLENNLNLNPTEFWNFIRSKSSCNGIPGEVVYRGDRLNDQAEIANAFAKHFMSVYDSSSVDSINCTKNWGNFNFSTITDLDVRTAIKKLKPKKTTGDDNIPAYIFKGCTDFLVEPLVHIFNLAINSNIFPDDLKTGVITPIFKKGDKCSVENYRPISILNSLAKIFEVILYNDILNFVQTKISKFQHGFLNDKSTVTNLCIFSEHASDAIKNKMQLDVIYTDCEKAFDKVDHQILLDMLVNYGFSKKSFKFMRSYLTQRPQTVKIGKFRSDIFYATSGVPQGSNLGPLLFILFINSLPDSISKSTGLLFADDFKIFKVICTDEDSADLQADFNSVVDWFAQHRMKLNVEKCAVMTYTRKQNFIDQQYYINGKKVKRISQVKDLGVCFQTNLKFNDHFEYIIAKAYKSLGFLMRNAKDFKISTAVTLYNAIVRPHLEYASCIWSPTALSNIDLIEKVQKRFLRYLYLRKHNIYPFMVSYKTLLSLFGMERLSDRRDKQDILFVYFVVNGLKYRDCDLINYINFHVPKIVLRLLNNAVFRADFPTCSPINRMMVRCNDFNKKYNIDLLTSDVKQMLLLVRSGGSV